MIKKAYKIVECRDGQLWFLYHGLNKSRIIPTGKWLKADKRTARDGGGSRWYKSGFHVFLTADSAYRYFQRYFTRSNRPLILISVAAANPRHKPGNTSVMLADEIFVLTKDKDFNCARNEHIKEEIVQKLH